ncbi:hypothetical protein GW17_00028632 [Ensete ventricosum]|nr:hypothetical protein GW17_00028632 [Ensete ventricosum]
MGERKVLNKYYPPDFDPAKIPRRRQPKNQQMKVRMMLPMSIRCNTCGTYIYKGTKFNSRKEDVVGEITFKTDPQNSDYTVESGASRNFEPWRDEDEVSYLQCYDKSVTMFCKRKRADEEMGDAMKSLENRAVDSKQDMDILAALEEMRSMKVLPTSSAAMICSITASGSPFGSKDFVRRIHDDEDDDIEELGQPSFSLSETSDNSLKGGSMLPKFILKSRSVTEGPKKPRTASTDSDPSEAEKEGKTNDTKGEGMTNGLLSLCQDYGSDDDQSD